MSNEYRLDVGWSDEDNCYVATSPEFPEISAFGDTRAEAIEEGEIALKLIIEGYLEDGAELPIPLKEAAYSGQLRLRLPKTLHGRAAAMAAKDGVSLNQFIQLAVEGRVSGREALRCAVEVLNETQSKSQIALANPVNP